MTHPDPAVAGGAPPLNLQALMAPTGTAAPAPSGSILGGFGLPQQAGGGQSIQELLQGTLLASYGSQATRAYTSDVYHFDPALIPDWIKESPQRKELMEASRTDQLDPYLPQVGGSAGGFDGTWQVYLGKHKEITDIPGVTPTRLPKGMSRNNADIMGLPDELGRGGSRAERKVHADNTDTASAVMNAPFLWSEEKIKQTMSRMNDAGMKVDDFGSMVKAWGDMVQVASMRYSLSHGKIKVTPWDVLDLYKSTSADARNFSGAGSEPFTGTKKMTARSVSDITEGDAWSALQHTLSQMLGHDPTHDEVRKFAYRMNAIAAAHPTVTTTTGEYDKGDLVSQSSHTTGGFDANDVQQQAYQRAQSDPDYAEYQSATTYFNAALSALGGIGNVTNQ